MHAWLVIAFERTLTASWQAGAMAAVVLALHASLGRRVSPGWRGAMWGLVFVRLVLPALPPSPTSALNLVRHEATAVDPGTSGETITFGVIAPSTPPVTPFAPGYSPTSSGIPRTLDETLDLTWLAARIWAAVAALLILRQLWAMALLSRRLASLERSADATAARLLARIARDMKTRCPDVIETARVSTPALAGIFRPVLLLPHGMSQRLAEAELELVLRHELAHARRRDVLVGLIVSLIAAVHWFNPLAWLAAARFRAERELACDELVLRSSADDRAGYGRTILKILQQFPPTRKPLGAVGIVGMLGGRRAVRRRIAAIAGGPVRRSWMLGPILLVALGCATLTGPRKSTTSKTRTPIPLETQPIESANEGLVAPDNQPADNPPGTVARVYDVRDLLIDVPDFTDAPQLGIQNDARATTTTRPMTSATTRLYIEPLPPPSTTATTKTTRYEKTRQQLVHDIIVRITSAVDPLSWRANTGTLGSVREKSGQLVITQTPANHEKIQRLLAELRGGRAIQVTVEARFLTVARSAENVLSGSNRSWTPVENSNFQMWNRYLDETEAKVLNWTAQQQKYGSLLTAPRLTLFNGQRAYVVVSRKTAYIADFQRIVDKATGEEAIHPMIGTIDSGVVLDCKPVVSADHKFVTLTFSPQTATLQDLIPQRWPGSTPGHEATIQVPRVQKLTLTATVTMPDRSTVLYRVPVVAEVEEKPGVIKKIEMDTLLLVKPTIIVQREQEQRQFPLLSTTHPTTAGP